MGETKFKTGDVITWTSSAAGTTKDKTGEVLGVLREGESPAAGFVRMFPAKQRPSHNAFKSGDGYSQRYLIKVQPPAKKRPGAKRGYTDPNPVYYAPLVRVIDGSSASAGRLVKPREPGR